MRSNTENGPAPAGRFRRCCGCGGACVHALGAQRRQQVFHLLGVALAGLAALDLDLARRGAARTDDDLPRYADQVGGRELAAGAAVGVVVEHVEPGCFMRRVELLAQPVAVGVADSSC
jgi:hypothetical protein